MKQALKFVPPVIELPQSNSRREVYDRSFELIEQPQPYLESLHTSGLF